MSNRRTTPQLVAAAIKGAQIAGYPIAAVEVHGGGFVRILINDPSKSAQITGSSTCDEIFGAASD